MFHKCHTPLKPNQHRESCFTSVIRHWNQTNTESHVSQVSYTTETKPKTQSLFHKRHTPWNQTNTESCFTSGKHPETKPTQSPVSQVANILKPNQHRQSCFTSGILHETKTTQTVLFHKWHTPWNQNNTDSPVSQVAYSMKPKQHRQSYFTSVILHWNQTNTDSHVSQVSYATETKPTTQIVQFHTVPYSTETKLTQRQISLCFKETAVHTFTFPRHVPLLPLQSFGQHPFPFLPHFVQLLPLGTQAKNASLYNIIAVQKKKKSTEPSQLINICMHTTEQLYRQFSIFSQQTWESVSGTKTWVTYCNSHLACE